jgi:hypothetical protein
MYNKPVIVVLTNNPLGKVLKEILAGIEEEGVLYEVASSTKGSSEELAVEAAGMSALGVGVGIFEDSVSVQERNMPPDNILFKATLKNGKNIRNIGANAARYVKGIAFKEVDR